MQGTQYREGKAVTAVPMSMFVGRIANMSVADFTVQVKILDTKYVWGQVRFLVEPLAGSGRAWVDANRISPVQGVAVTR